MGKVIVGDKDGKVAGANKAAAIVTSGTKGTADVEFDGVAACLEGGRAAGSKRCVAFVRDGGAPSTAKPSALVGDGAVAFNVTRGMAACYQSAIAASGSRGSVDVRGRGSIGVVLAPGPNSTGRLSKAITGESLLLFSYTRQGKTRWVVGVTGKGSQTVTVQDGLRPGRQYKLHRGKLIPA